MKLFLSVLSSLYLATALAVGSVITLASPDKRIALEISSSVTQSDRAAEFRVKYGGKAFLSGTLGLDADGQSLLQDAGVKSSRTSVSDKKYVMPFHKSNPVRDHYRELILQFSRKTGPVSLFNVVFRAYNDGLAYRYEVPEQAGVESIEITDEPGTFRFAGDPQMWPLYLAHFRTSHEGIYETARFSALATNRLMDVPLLAEFDNGVCVAIAQASLRNYAGLYLRAEGSGQARQLRCELPSLPTAAAVKVRSRLPLSSPWRVLLIGDSPGRLIESSLLLNLNEPNAIGDVPWLQAGKATFYWWSGVQAPLDVQKAFEWEKNFIDFAARNGFRFHAVIGAEGDQPWYHQTKAGYYPPGPDADVTRVRAGFPMKKVVDYARSKGVGIRLWVPIEALRDRLEQAFSQYQEWGIAGLMVDYLDRDDQEMVLLAEEVLKSAARHHLHIQFHGVWAPTGLNRTYPNLFNHEGVLNLEFLKWSNLCSPEHNVTVPFTRMLAGPMDFHQGGFRSVTREAFKPRHVEPVMLGTRAHHLATYVVYENPMPMVADRQSAYENQAGFDFLQRVPTTWDESRVLKGEVGDYIVVARRKGAEWFLGSMTDWTPRSLEIPMDFLGSGDFEIMTWADADTGQDPNQVTVSTRQINKSAKLKIQLVTGGGHVARIRPLNGSKP